MTTNAYGRIAAMNAAAQSLTGWTETAALDQPIERVLQIVDDPGRVPADRPPIRNYSILVRRDGTEREIDQHAVPLQDEQGEVSGCLLVFRDITEQRRIDRDRELQLTAARQLAAIREWSNDAIIGRSLDGTIRSWNPAAETLFGHLAGAAVGRHISVLIPAERRDEEDAIVASLSSGRTVEHFITERQRADGTLVSVSLTIAPVRNDRGHVIGGLTIARDLTQLLAAGERERALQAEIARLAADLPARPSLRLR
jgi:PAS domain S-box-containing protein